MPFSFIRTVHTAFAWSAFGLGVPLNLAAVWAILRHTPPVMRVYAKILLQTCVTDLLVLVGTVLTDELVLVGDGVQFVWSNGLLSPIDDSTWSTTFGWLALFLWYFLELSNLFGFVAQFLYRYLVLCRNRTLSICRYFGLLGAVLCFPLVFVIANAAQRYPPPEHRTLHDQTVAEQLGFQNASQVVFSGINSHTNPTSDAINFFIVAISASAYTVMLSLGWLMFRHVRGGLRMVGATSATQQRALKMQVRLTRILVIQTLLVGTIWTPLVLVNVGLVFKVDFTGSMHYMTIPAYWASALNPLVTLLTISDYRRAILFQLRRLFTANGG